MADATELSPAGDAGDRTQGAVTQDRLSVTDFDGSRLPSWARGPARRVQGFVVRYQDHPVVAVVQRFSAIMGADRALSIGARAFVAFVPLVLLLTSKFSVHGDSLLAHHFITTYDLHDKAAAATRTLSTCRPPVASKAGWPSCCPSWSPS